MTNNLDLQEVHPGGPRRGSPAGGSLPLAPHSRPHANWHCLIGGAIAEQLPLDHVCAPANGPPLGLVRPVSSETPGRWPATASGLRGASAHRRLRVYAVPGAPAEYRSHGARPVMITGPLRHLKRDLSPLGKVPSHYR